MNLLATLAQYLGQISQKSRPPLPDALAKAKTPETVALRDNLQKLLKSYYAQEHKLEQFRAALAKQQKLLSNVAYKDSVTHLLNRRGFEESAKRYLAESARYQRFLPLLLLDLDGFKNVNDSLGHAAGDMLLKNVAKRLIDATREEDLIARLGGNEFALMLPNVNSSYDAAVVAQRIVESLQEPYTIKKQIVHVGASIGISYFPDVEPEIREVLRYASRALSQAKSTGCNSYKFYNIEMNDVYQERTYIVKALHQAVENNEFHLVYQPQVDLKTHKTLGVEALLRWNHPEHGTISPEIFITIAEEIGLINTIGEWVIKQACADLRSWKQFYNKPLTLAINLSAQQLTSDKLIYVLHRTIAKNKLDPSHIELELTETAVMQNSVVSVDMIHQIHDLGVKICIDDFGTGYSSLQRLTTLPISTLKIDRSFIHNLDQDENNAIIAQSIVELGKNLNLAVVAEGIETEQELAFLQQCECQQGQGYYFSKPVCVDKLINYLTHH